MNSVRKIRKETWLEIAFLTFLFFFYLSWARIQPLNASPDEEMRYQIAEYIYNHGTLPHGGDEEIRNATWGISYGFNPILDYMICALFMKLVSLVHESPYVLLMAARLVSVLSGVGTGFFAIRIGKKLFPQKGCGLFVVLVTLLPGSVFITSYVNCDALALCSTAVIFYMWICGLESHWEWKHCVGLALSISVCALTYYNAYGFILCSILLFAISILIMEPGEKRWQTFWKKGAVVSVIVLALIGWWFVRNYIIYDGDFLGQATSSMYAEKYAAEEFRPSVKATPQHDGVSIWSVLWGDWGDTGAIWLDTVLRSFIGRFGFFSVLLPRGFENVYLLALGIGLLGIFWHPIRTFAVRCKGEWTLRGIFHWILVLAILIPNFLNLYYSYATDYSPQGRYSMPMLLPLMYFVTMGTQNTLERLCHGKERPGVMVNAVLCVIVAGASVWVYAYIFWPAYMQQVPLTVPNLLLGV